MYPVREDSLFLVKVTKKYLKDRDKKIKVLDLGTGSGVQSKNLIDLQIPKNNIIASDINKEALVEVKKLNIRTKKSDLFNKIKEKFDLIIFNPPYLPKNKHDQQKDTTGGKKGDEVIIRFIKELKNHLTKKGSVLLLTSSLTPEIWIKLANSKGLTVRKIATKGLFFEKLYVWEIKLSQ